MQANGEPLTDWAQLDMLAAALPPSLRSNTSQGYKDTTFFTHVHLPPPPPPPPLWLLVLLLPLLPLLPLWLLLLLLHVLVTQARGGHAAH